MNFTNPPPRDGDPIMVRAAIARGKFDKDAARALIGTPVTAKPGGPAVGKIMEARIVEWADGTKTLMTVT